MGVLSAWHSPAESCFLTVLEAKSPNSSVAGVVLSRRSWDHLFSASVPAAGGYSQPWCSLAGSCITPVSAAVSTWPALSSVCVVSSDSHRDTWHIT